MKIIKLAFLIAITHTSCINAQIQVSPVADDFKIINIGNNAQGDYTRNLILLHEIYNGAFISMNNAVGTITAFRGSAASYNRINIVEVNTSSAYANINATIRTSVNDANWTLKTCIYNGKKYIAVDVPYSAAYHDLGYKFSGWTKSTGENMKSINYQVNGLPVNTTILTDIKDFTPNMDETHQVNNFHILSSNTTIGTNERNSNLTVAGNIASREVKVTVNAGADFVFEKNYDLPSLDSIDKFIQENKHLPEIASAEEMKKDGINLSEMNIKLLQKIEEMTLYMIEQNKKINELQKQNKNFENIEARLKKIEDNIKP
ncbi:hypothetical protein SAMN02927916_3360 [Flavobacterium anhuiense]|uniref:Uncharacterized protein n=1 Tax=Flavobacterium anhuiense TaxID=459526 RepID=A0ABY0LY61_9FLAO|nr:hypothetical protein [Flavobacterium anhuiense]SCY78237.1 hypothetical protein SAMN02927916_3360 [Flavobacterium anhuiense]